MILFILSLYFLCTGYKIALVLMLIYLIWTICAFLGTRNFLNFKLTNLTKTYTMVSKVSQFSEIALANRNKTGSYVFLFLHVENQFATELINKNIQNENIRNKNKELKNEKNENENNEKNETSNKKPQVISLKILEEYGFSTLVFFPSDDNDHKNCIMISKNLDTTSYLLNENSIIFNDYDINISWPSVSTNIHAVKHKIEFGVFPETIKNENTNGNTFNNLVNFVNCFLISQKKWNNMAMINGDNIGLISNYPLFAHSQTNTLSVNVSLPNNEKYIEK